jgi:hypothetical protein
VLAPPRPAPPAYTPTPTQPGLWGGHPALHAGRGPAPGARPRRVVRRAVYARHRRTRRTRPGC